MAATRSLSASLQHINRILLADDLVDMPDAELVGRFVTRRDDAAFTALVRRYGPIVFGVCRRVLRHEQDAEDAFQATFIVLARDAAFVKCAGEVGNWLYGVAYNIARKAKAARHRRELKEQQAAARQQPESSADALDDLREILDAELHALPDKYRAPIVLCDLRGLTAREAAVEIGCPPKTLGTRLSRGRSLLARRLTRRGVALSATALPAALASRATAAVPLELLGSTVHAATAFAADSAAAVTPAVAALTTGASNVMMLKTLKYTAVLICGTLVLAGLAHGPFGSGLVAAYAPGGSSASGSPTQPRSVKKAQPNHLAKLHHMFVHVLAHVGFVSGGSEASAAADDKKDDKPALSGVWVRKEGEMKIEFADKNVVKISPHGKDDVILILCEYTLEKEGLVKAKVTGFEGNADARKKLMQLLPVDTAFSFTWKAKDDAATLDDLKGDEIERFKSLLVGDFGKK